MAVSDQKDDMVSSAQHIDLEQIPTHNTTGNDHGLTTTEPTALEADYSVSAKTCLVLFCMGMAWGTCTLANVGPSSTYSYAIEELGGTAIESWVPNAALFPLIGLQPIWVRIIINRIHKQKASFLLTPTFPQTGSLR